VCHWRLDVSEFTKLLIGCYVIATFTAHACGVQEVETQRRLDLEKRLADQEKKDSLKKRKKIKF